jgi:ferredoxin
MRIEIDRELCEGYGVCVQSAPDLFALDDEGNSEILQADVPADLERGAMLAEKSCPMQAVRLS